MENDNNSSSQTGKILLGSLAIAGFLYYIFKPVNSGDEEKVKNKKARVFISFAKEDEIYRDYLVEQAKNNRSPFDFIDMSVKQPWQESVWKEKCRTKLKSCDGVIVLLSGKTWNSSGARWEVKCAKEEDIPVIGMHIFKNNMKTVPPELRSSKIISWNWKELEKIIKSF